MTLVKCFVFGMGCVAGIFIIGEGVNLLLAASALKLDDIEDDGFITVYPNMREG